MSYVFGIDGGGTKTICILIDENRVVLGRGEAGPSNYQTQGIETAKQSIEVAIERAVLSAKIEPNSNLNIEAICLGLAGVARPKDIEIVQFVVQNLQLTNTLPVTRSLLPRNIVICSDCAIALVGGVGNPVGIAVIAGTGSIVFGQNRQGKTKRVGGWGYILGDEGSGYDIAVAGLQAALKFYDGRSEFTVLAQKFQQHLGLNNLEELVEVVYRRGWGVTEIAALAPIVDRAAAEGDRVADGIISRAVAELTFSTKTAISALFSPTEEFEIVTIGGVWGSEANFRGRFESAISAIAPNAKVILPRSEPAFGAALLALNALKN
ncbi:BadF/BadG/BcrA/BcrD ATPase family protein [Microcoleus sp. PH2017_08_TRC_O_A]|uniref:N-acetylglucosamine kinase n=1 Tax=Microcoleus sp. PH2017_08_TRC_O_A TaxID=2798819 RepID=UPI001E09696D|nr:BadF/BadG/BcrA/BcrD ATPase family protein [Microcoleus sp. PH2017_08_TRC_O_A]MCC3454506.1 ATPase [Microcoleus sp. PH2017_08_TRC_O_A]TAG60131.1 MAG: ATPase [Oscillatoriales cyanobacterium]